MKNLLYIPLIALFACGGTTTTTEAENEETSTSISLTAEQSSRAGIETGKLKKRPLSIVIHATGQIDVPPNQRAEIHSPMDVFVEDVKVLPGDQVKKGDVLAIVNHPSLIAMQQQYHSLEIEKDRLIKQISRKQELLSSGVASQSELDQLKSDLSIADTQLRGLAAQLAMLNISPSRPEIQKGKLTASFDGQVVELGVNKGALLTPGQVAFHLVDAEHKHLELNVFPRDAVNLETGQLIQFKVTNKETKGEAVVYLVNPMVSDNHTVSVHAHISGDESGYLVGDFVDARIETVADSTYLIPSKELIYSGDVYSLFVKSGDSFERMDVITGRKDDNFTELLGPTELFDAEVVLQGNYYINGM